MRGTRAMQAAGIGLLLVLGSIGSARALTDEEIFQDFRFDFLTPGARALAMGGAFVAVSDDGTAIHTNPAGLHFLTRPDVLVEFRVIDRDTQTFNATTGSTEVDPLTGPTDLPFLERDATSDHDTVTELTFLSFSWPFELARWGRRVTLSGSRHVLLSQDRSLTSEDPSEARFSFGSFGTDFDDLLEEVRAYSLRAPTTGFLDADIVYWSAGVSVEVHEDFSLGVTLTYATLDLEQESLTRVIDPKMIIIDPADRGLTGEPDTDLYRSEIDDSDDDLAFTIGMHWHPNSVFPGGRSPWQLGAVYRKGAEFSVRESLTFNGISDGAFDNRIVVPDRYSIGVSYRTPERWLFSAEFEQIEYSDLMDGFRSGVNYVTSSRLADAAFFVDPDTPIEFEVDDGNVWRAGAEYAFLLGGNPRRKLSLQAGYFRTPDNHIRLTQFNAAVSNTEVNSAFRTAFAGSEDEDHWTAGVGLTLGAYAFHVAGESSDEGTQVVGSFRFLLNREGKRGNAP